MSSKLCLRSLRPSLYHFLYLGQEMSSLIVIGSLLLKHLPQLLPQPLHFLLKLLISLRNLLHDPSNCLLCLFLNYLHNTLTLPSTDILPPRLYLRNILPIDLTHINIQQVYQQLWVYFLPFYLFSLYVVVYQPAEINHLLHELRSQLVDLHRVQFLEVVLVC